MDPVTQSAGRGVTKRAQPRIGSAIAPARAGAAWRAAVAELDDEAFVHWMARFACDLSRARCGFVIGRSNRVEASYGPSLTAEEFRERLNADQSKEIVSKAFDGSAGYGPTGSNGADTILVAPLRDEKGQVTKILGVILGPDRSLFWDATLAQLSLVAECGAVQRVASENRRLEEAAERAGYLVEALGGTHDAACFEDAALRLAESARFVTGCDLVTIGWKGRVVAVSGVRITDRKAAHTREIETLIDEAATVGDVLSSPWSERMEDCLPSSDRSDLLRRLEMASFLAVPLVPPDRNGAEEEEVPGAWVFWWEKPGERSGRDVAVVKACAEPVAGVLALLEDARPRGWRGRWHHFWKRAARWKRILAVSAVAVVVLAMLLPFPYRIGARAEVRPVVVRQVTAPFDGLLERPHVKPGQQVDKGDLLATLDGKELGWQIAQAHAEREATIVKRDQAMKERRVSEARMLHLESEALRHELELLEFRQENLDVRAPVAGTILAGDLERSEGVPVQVGQKLFEIAPAGAMRVELAVPDSEIGRVEKDQAVTVRLQSRAGRVLRGEVSDFHPVSEIVEDENVFIVYADLHPSDDAGDRDLPIRSGMKGRGRIAAGYRPLGWIAGHRLWEWLWVRFG